ncbi:MAG: type VI secretion system tip protein VgrG [Planctomycetes bacterium]|nr:type VI secretion system tip protein VgrG [Planctomycetota bacterium]
MGSATYTQAGRPLAVTTPLGPDVLLLVGFRGREEISKPFQYVLDLVASSRSEIPFERLMGQRMTVELRRPRGQSRYFSGIVSRFSQGHSDLEFTEYQAELVPDMWLLTKRHRSRIFQHLSVPDILRQVLQGLDVSFQIRGDFQPRDYCAQYRESDFDFASRLMEEEGIYYFFLQNERGHQLVLANTPQGHPDVPEMREVPFENTPRDGQADCITAWQKVQELRSGKCELWDHCFELPRMHLDARKSIQDDVPVGRVNHKLTAGLNGKLELYDYPGGYAQRFDGIDRGGGEHPEELRKIFEDNQRTVSIRMQQEAAAGIMIQGAGTCRQFLPGHKFSLVGHGHGDGDYVLTKVQHLARQPGFRSDDRAEGFTYENTFSAIPYALPYRPARETPRPTIHGTQTATVVGPPGKESFVDKYGRVKVQLNWDREGRNDADSSCWIRVAQQWAGKVYGAFFWPRIGHEVVVAFEEGDPDRPIIIGSVYNAENTTPYLLPESAEIAGIVTQSTPGGNSEEYNELSFDDKKGNELIYMHAQKNFVREVENDDHLRVGNEQTIEIKNGRKQTIHQGDDEKVLEKGSVRTKVTGSVVLQWGDNSTKRGGRLYLSSDLAQLDAPMCAIEGYEFATISGAGSRLSLVEGGAILEAESIILKAGKILLDAGLIEATGMVICPILSADAVIGKTYSSGAGNIL